MYPKSNELTKMHETAKTHKVDSTDNVELKKLKFHPIIDKTGTYTYKAAKAISQYIVTEQQYISQYISKCISQHTLTIYFTVYCNIVTPFCNSEYTIKDTQFFAKLIEELPSLKEDEEYVSCDIESLFANIPIKDTIDCILDQIYVQHKLKPICCKSLFKRLFVKLSTKVTFTFNDKFCKQTDG